MVRERVRQSLCVVLGVCLFASVAGVARAETVPQVPVPVGLFAAEAEACTARQPIEGQPIEGEIRPISIGICTWECSDGSTGHQVGKNGDDCVAYCLAACLLRCKSYEWIPT